MSADAEWALQKGVRATLLADAGVTALLGDPPRVHDEPPDDPIFPYVTFGRSETRPGDGEGLLEHVLHLHVWSRYGGRKEAKEVVGGLRAALDGAAPALAGFSLTGLRVVFADVLRAADGRTTQAIVRLRALTAPAA